MPEQLQTHQVTQLKLADRDLGLNKDVRRVVKMMINGNLQILEKGKEEIYKAMPEM